MRNKKLLLLILALLLAFTFSGCSKKITKGEIYEKEFKPAYTSTSVVPIVHSNGKMTFTTFIPITNHYPDRWCIRIKSLNVNDDGKYDTAEYYVTQEVYEACNIGDIFEYDEDRDFSEEPVYREEQE